MKGKLQSHPLQGSRPTYEVNPELWGDEYILDFDVDAPVFFIQSNGEKVISVFDTWVSFSVKHCLLQGVIHFERTNTVIDKLVGKIDLIKNGRSEFLIMKCYWAHNFPEWILDFDFMISEDETSMISIYASNEADAMEMNLRL